MALDFDGKRAVLYTPATPVNGRFIPSFVIEDEPFHRPTDWDFGPDFQTAEELTRKYNARLGYTQAEADAVVSSSIAAANRLHAAGIRPN